MGMLALILGAAIATHVPVPVEIWTAGDYGDVQRLSGAVRKAFQKSSRFSLSAGNKPGTVYVTVPIDPHISHQVGGRTAITASIGVAYSPGNASPKFLEVVKCWDGEMSKCGDQAVAFVARHISE
jgi:hypothetical protein